MSERLQRNNKNEKRIEKRETPESEPALSPLL